MPKFSQNFLVNASAADKIAEAVYGIKGGFLIEIGPGKGFLTKRLVKLFGNNFTAVEIDGEMVEILKRDIENPPDIIHSDFLAVNLDEIVPESSRAVFAGNLPYSCAGAILRKVLEFDRFSGAVFMFQKEVAKRILAKPGDKDYGVLSLASQCFADVGLVSVLKAGSFFPVPKVSSAVVKFTRKKEQVFSSLAERKNFFKLLKASFAQRRKTISNSLSSSLGIDKQKAEQVLLSAKINPSARAETLSLADFLRLSKIFST